MATPSQSSPLDLDQFGPTLANPDAAALLAECKRQREEIARLRAAARLGSLALDAMISARGDVCDGGDLRSLFPTGDEDAIKALDALDAALASEGGAE